ncbi:DUF6036 family nucleotidyltransferase [Bdellovibrionota bacterium]
MTGPLEVLRDVVSRFESAEIDYFLIGSLASMYYGKPRFTNDIDLVVKIKPSNIKQFEKLFPIEDYYCPPFEVLRDEVVRGGSFNLIHHESGIKVDIVVLKQTEFYDFEYKRRKKVKLTADFEAYIASPEDIIIKKLDFYREGGSEKHLDDIREIVASVDIDLVYLDKWLSHFGLNKIWEKI